MAGTNAGSATAASSATQNAVREPPGDLPEHLVGEPCLAHPARAEARREHLPRQARAARRAPQAAAARRARPSTKMSSSSSNRSSGSASANSPASAVMFGNAAAGSEVM